MRALGPVLVIASVALGAGGVAYTRAADPRDRSVEATRAAETAEAAEAQDGAAQGMCPIQLPGELERGARARVVVPLNRAGYNYAEPGAPRPEAAAAGSAAPPAAPAPRPEAP